MLASTGTKWLGRAPRPGQIPKEWGPRFRRRSPTLGVLGIVFVALALRRRTSSPSRANSMVLAPLLCLCAIHYVVSTGGRA